MIAILFYFAAWYATGLISFAFWHFILSKKLTVKDLKFAVLFSLMGPGIFIFGIISFFSDEDEDRVLLRWGKEENEEE